MPGLGGDRAAQLGRQVVQAGLRRHPAGRAVARLPAAAQPAVRTDVAVEPGVAVRRLDPLRLAPGEQGLDDRVHAAERLQPPRAGVGHVDADLAQQVAHLKRVAQVGPQARSVLQHNGIPSLPLGCSPGLTVGPRPDRPGRSGARPRPGRREARPAPARHRGGRRRTPTGPWCGGRRRPMLRVGSARRASEPGRELLALALLDLRREPGQLGCGGRGRRSPRSSRDAGGRRRAAARSGRWAGSGRLPTGRLQAGRAGRCASGPDRAEPAPRRGRARPSRPTPWPGSSREPP